MNSRDRQAIDSFNAASIGVVSTGREGSRKRPRDDNDSVGGSRRFINNPYSNMGHNRLHDNTQSSNTGSNSNLRSNRSYAQGHSRAPSQNLGDRKLAKAIFLTNPNASQPSLADLEHGSHTITSTDSSSRNGPVLRYPDASVTSPFPQSISYESDAIISGKSEPVFSFATILDTASVPSSTHRDAAGEVSTLGRPRRSSSVDPLDLPDRLTPGPSVTPPKLADDDIIKDVIEEIQPGPRRPVTPRGETMFEKGRVKPVAESISRTEVNTTPKVLSFLKTQPHISSHPAYEGLTGTKSSTTGQPIYPRMTTFILGNMKMKPRSELIIQQRIGLKGSGLKLQPDAVPPASSSPNPADIIDKTTPGLDVAIVDTADNDSIDEILEVPRTGRPRSGPKQQTLFEQGRVRQMVSQAESSAPPILTSFLKPQSYGPYSSKGQLPIPGMIRKPVVKSMGMKSRLHIHQTGSGALSAYRPSSKPEEFGLKQQQPEATTSSSTPIKLPIQEWYCATERRASSRDGQESYYLIFDGKTLDFVREKRDAEMPIHTWQMKKLDFAGFEVPAANAEEDTEAILFIHFTLTSKYANCEYWKKLANGATSPKMLVTLSVGAKDPNQWKLLIDRLSAWICKTAMKSVFSAPDHNPT